MVEPNKNMTELAPIFRRKAEGWISEANAFLKARGLTVRVTETYRTRERQNYLYSLGRNAKGQIIDVRRVVTYTTDSSHEYRIALDWVPYDPKRRVVLYDRALYGSVYRALPLSSFGLQRYTWENPHIELASGQRAARALGIVANMPLTALPKAAR